MVYDRITRPNRRDPKSMRTRKSASIPSSASIGKKKANEGLEKKGGLRLERLIPRCGEVVPVICSFGLTKCVPSYLPTAYQENSDRAYQCGFQAFRRKIF